MKRNERKHLHIITNLTQKTKLLEKATIYNSNHSEYVKNILKTKKKRKSEEKNP